MAYVALRNAPALTSPDTPRRYTRCVTHPEPLPPHGSDDGECCVICDAPLASWDHLDRRTALLWSRAICRDCGDRLDVPEPIELEPEWALPAPAC